MIDTTKFIELCQKYDLEDIYEDGSDFGIEGMPLFSWDNWNYIGTKASSIGYENGKMCFYDTSDMLFFGESLLKLEKNIIACIKKYKKVKKKYKIKQIREM